MAGQNECWALNEEINCQKGQRRQYTVDKKKVHCTYTRTLLNKTNLANNLNNKKRRKHKDKTLNRQ